MIRLSQLVGQRVIAKGSGAQLGSIRHVLLDPQRGSITFAHLVTAEGRQLIMAWSSVTEVGVDGVFVHGGEVARPAEGEQEKRLVGGELELLGKSVLTDEGDSLGELEDIELDELSGRVARLHVPGQAVTVGRFVTLGPDAIIIAATRPSSTAASAR
ncbi:MAG TPA: PRC-barrel domain-containing protein [Candidatus Limnocylindrales bacterium]|nr:PRC-barrel domain-containing protein [Candidatus Limnocylindrales bacterium]